MSKITKTFISFFLMGLLAFGQNANTEFRSTWVITWEHINQYNSVDENKARIRQIMDDHVEANMNAVLWQARQSGTAYYASSYEPWGSYAGGSYPGYDPLEYAIEQAHLRGLELHAWVNSFQASSTVTGAPAQAHPEWICRDRSGNAMPSYRALSPGLPEVRNYLVNVIMEIVNNYDVDGIHLDYVRWNEHSDLTTSRNDVSELEQISRLDGDVSQEEIDQLLNPLSGRYLYDINHTYNSGVPSGYSSWEDWWRSSVTDYVVAVHDSIQAIKPYVRLSVAALGKYNWSGWNGYDVVYQDAALWFNEGYIDQLTPMHYHWTTSSGFYNMLEGGCPSCWSQYIQPGIDAGRLYTVGPGSYILASNNVWDHHSSIVNTSRTVDWVDGFQFFSYGTWEDYQYWSEAGTSFFNEKTKIRPINANSTAPSSPTVILNQENNLNYTITLEPNASDVSDMWNILYRSTESSTTVENAKIVGVYFGHNPISIVETFDGTQDYNGNYYYFATSANRFWLESTSSNEVASTPLTSLPPTVVQTLPENNEFVNINSPMEIYFSKTMDETLAEGAITISPAVEGMSFSWSIDHKILQIHRTNHLAFNQLYTVSINENVQDINGSGFDGNSDGVAGGSYSFSFTTFDQDLNGPVIVQAIPALDGSDESFFNDGVFTLVFDELVDHESITTENLLISNNQMSDVQMLKVDIDNQTIVSFKQYNPINTGDSYLTIDSLITDTLGNTMSSNTVIPFTVSNDGLFDVNLIDAFLQSGNWWDPEGSGSTVGTIGSETTFGYSSSIYVPATSPYESGLKSSYINYSWDTNASNHLLREYLSGGAPREVIFDATQTLQCYVFGDGSNNKFRFAIDEGNGSSWPAHEVSVWFDVDWKGWKLIEWDLSDPSMVGNWIGNGVLDGSAYRIDSFQMTWSGDTNYTSGRIYFDELRAVSKAPVSIEKDKNKNIVTASTFYLENPYPNPFNASIKIPFYIPENGVVSISIIDPIGREVDVLQNGRMLSGNHELLWANKNISSGIYFVVVRYQDTILSKRIIMLK